MFTNQNFPYLKKHSGVPGTEVATLKRAFFCWAFEGWIVEWTPCDPMSLIYYPKRKGLQVRLMWGSSDRLKDTSETPFHNITNRVFHWYNLPVGKQQNVPGQAAGLHVHYKRPLCHQINVWNINFHRNTNSKFSDHMGWHLYSDRAIPPPWTKE